MSTEEQRCRWKINKTRWRLENPDKAKAIAKRHYLKHRDKICQGFKEYYIENKSRWDNRDVIVRRRSVVSKHGITLEEYDELLMSQGGLCATCDKPESRRHKSGKIMALVIDHNHTTGKIRGLLCHRCNAAIGLLDEDLERIEKLIQYLRKDKSLSSQQ